MSVEIAFPLEFLVPERPVSHQAKRRGSVSRWKDRVREASKSALPEGHFSTDGPISVTLFYFPETEMTGDIDNIIKPILDALCKHIYCDDRQVERIWIQRFDPGKVFQFTAPSAALRKAIDGGKPVLYVRLSDDVSEGLV